ncbi:glycosyltransferase [Azospirillum sp.]|uniref:glycosyltransferase n=1 Tax=Azospirillum sp. TaxID=34012 RepID=UPI003D722AFF
MPDPIPPPRVALVTTHIAPAVGYGGIAESTARIAGAWAAAGRPFALCASDASEGTPHLRPAEVGLPAAVPVHLYRAHGWKRWGLGIGAAPEILRVCRQAEAVYISGIATWPTSLAGLACRMLRRPFVVAVRGGLMPGHIEHIRRRKPLKWLFYRMVTLPTLTMARAVHATSTVEADGVRDLLPTVPVAVVPNAVDLREWPPLPPRAHDGRRVTGYIGRLSPEKGILPFLRAWLATRRPGDRFLVAGSGDGSYAAEFARLAASANGAVELRGYLRPDGVRALLAESDLVVLPSGLGEGGLRENFGNAVVEALASGRPALVTRGMAWDDLEEEGAGLVFAADASGARSAMERAQALSVERLAAMGAAARRLAADRYALAPVADRLWRLVTEEV